MKRGAFFWVCFIAVVSISTTAFAGPIKFFAKDLQTTGGLHVTEFPNSIATQTEFLSHLDEPIVEDFEGFSNDDHNMQPTDLTIDFGQAGTALLRGGYVSAPWDENARTNGRFSTSATGDQFLEVRTGAGGLEDVAYFTLKFEKPQAAFGFFGTDFENSLTSFTFENEAGEASVWDIPFNDPSGSAFFLGWIDAENPFTKVTFDGLNITGDWYGFDDFTIAVPDQIAHPTPEPGTFFLLFVGLACAGSLARGKKEPR